MSEVQTVAIEYEIKCLRATAAFNYRNRPSGLGLGKAPPMALQPVEGAQVCPM